MGETAEPVLLKLSAIAREVGVAPKTIEQHQRDFFPVQRLGSQRYVSRRDYGCWLERMAAGSIALPGAPK